jgi:hypothetical protein
MLWWAEGFYFDIGDLDTCTLDGYDTILCVFIFFFSSILDRIFPSALIQDQVIPVE